MNLRHRIQLQSRSLTLGAGGEHMVNWVDIAVIWASIESLHQNPQVRGDKVEYPVIHEITTRYSAQYKNAHRLVFGTRIFKILSIVNPGEKNVALVFRCEEGAS